MPRFLHRADVTIPIRPSPDPPETCQAYQRPLLPDRRGSWAFDLPVDPCWTVGVTSRASSVLAAWLAVALPIAIRLETADEFPRAVAAGVAATVLAADMAVVRWPKRWVPIAAVGAFVLFRLLPAPEAAAVTLFALGSTAVWLSAGTTLWEHAERRAVVGPWLLPAAGAAVCTAIGFPWAVSLLFLAAATAMVAGPIGREQALDERLKVSASRLAPATWPEPAAPAEPVAQRAGAADASPPLWIPGWVGTGLRLPVLAWFAVAIPVNLVQEVVHDVTQRRLGVVEALLPPYSVFGGRVAWDSINFVRIAAEGYPEGQFLEASFPGYPLLVRWFMWVTGLDVYTSAVLVSAAGGLAATVLFWRWTESMDLDLRGRLIALALFLLFPASFVLFGVAYADSVMMAFLLASLLALNARRDAVAGLLGAAATFTRPTALVLVPAIVVLILQRDGVLVVEASTAASDALERTGRSLRLGAQRVRVVTGRLRAGHALSLLPLAGIGCYAVWMWRHTGDPVYFWSIQTDHYGHRPMTSVATWLKVEFIDRPAEFVHNGPDAINQVLATITAAGSLLATPTLGRRLGWGYATLVLASVTILWATAMWFAPTRYLLPAMPPLAVLSAQWLRGRPATTRAVLVSCAVTSLVASAAFAAVYRLNW